MSDHPEIPALAPMMAVQVRLALATAPQEQERWVSAARALGLSSAEIAVTFGGTSFDVRIATAIRLALAYRDDDPRQIEQAARIAAAMRLTPAQCAALRHLATQAGRESCAG